MQTFRVVWAIHLTLLFAACSDGGAPPRADQGDGVVTLRWQPPTENESGEPLTDLVAYHVLYGRSEDDLRYSMRIADPSQTTAVISGLGRGTWFFSIVAVNSAGKASKPSATASKTIR